MLYDFQAVVQKAEINPGVEVFLFFFNLSYPVDLTPLEFPKMFHLSYQTRGPLDTNPAIGV